MSFDTMRASLAARSSRRTAEGRSRPSSVTTRIAILYQVVEDHLRTFLAEGARARPPHVAIRESHFVSWVFVFLICQLVEPGVIAIETDHELLPRRRLAESAADTARRARDDSDLSRRPRTMCTPSSIRSRNRVPFVDVAKEMLTRRKGFNGRWTEMQGR